MNGGEIERGYTPWYEIFPWAAQRWCWRETGEIIKNRGRSLKNKPFLINRGVRESGVHLPIHSQINKEQRCGFHYQNADTHRRR